MRSDRLSLGVLLAVALVGCGGAAPARDETATPASAATASLATPSAPVPSPAPTSPVSGSGATPSDGVGIADARGDATPAYLDIVLAGASVRQQIRRLTLEMDLAAPLPTDPADSAPAAYRFSLDTDGDARPDAIVSFEGLPSGGFQPVLTIVASGRVLAGDAFPGMAGVSHTIIDIGLDLDAIGCPATVDVRAGTERTPAGSTVGDAAPADGLPPMSIRTGC